MQYSRSSPNGHHASFVSAYYRKRTAPVTPAILSASPEFLLTGNFDCILELNTGEKVRLNPGGGDSRIKMTGMLVVPLRGYDLSIGTA